MPKITGTMANDTPARRTFKITSTITVPIMVSDADSRLSSPCPENCRTFSTSEVMRVISWPVCTPS